MATATENEQQFRQLAELLPETVYEMDTSGHFCYVGDPPGQHPQEIGVDTQGRQSTHLPHGLGKSLVKDTGDVRKMKGTTDQNMP